MQQIIEWIFENLSQPRQTTIKGLSGTSSVSDDNAFCRRPAPGERGRSRGGVSSGAAMHAALKVAARRITRKVIVVLQADPGERHLSTALFCQDERGK